MPAIVRPAPKCSGTSVGRMEELVPAAVDEVLTLAQGWLGWDGRPVHRDGNAWPLRQLVEHVSEVTYYARMMDQIR